MFIFNPQIACEEIRDIIHKGDFAHLFSHYSKKYQNDYLKIFGSTKAFGEFEEFTEGLLEIYSHAMYLKNNIQNVPHYLTVDVDHCCMSGNLRVRVNEDQSMRPRKTLLEQVYCDYIVEYKPRTFSDDGSISHAVEQMMRYYVDEDHNDDAVLLKLFAAVYYHCSEISVFKLQDDLRTRAITEVPIFSLLEQRIFSKFPNMVDFDDKDMEFRDCRNPKNLFMIFKNDHQVNDVELAYLKEFDICIKFNVYIEDFKISRTSILEYCEDKKGFIHRTKDESVMHPQSSYGNYGEVEDKIYFDANDINTLIKKAKGYSFRGLSLESLVEIDYNENDFY